MILSEEIGKFNFNDLQDAFDQISRYERTGILIDGIVRTTSENFAKVNKQDDYKFHRLTCEAFLYEMSRRYVAGIK